MNNRIFELAKKADLVKWDTLSSGAITPDHESVAKAMKFADLIIKECLKEIYPDDPEYDYDDDHRFDEGFNQALSSVHKRITEHFGVK